MVGGRLIVESGRFPRVRMLTRRARHVSEIVEKASAAETTAAAGS